MFVILMLRWPYTLLCNKFVVSSVCKYDIELLIIKVFPTCLVYMSSLRTGHCGELPQSVASIVSIVP